jgi:hypothetical protein
MEDNTIYNQEQEDKDDSLNVTNYSEAAKPVVSEMAYQPQISAPNTNNSPSRKSEYIYKFAIVLFIVSLVVAGLAYFL